MRIPLLATLALIAGGCASAPPSQPSHAAEQPVTAPPPPVEVVASKPDPAAEELEAKFKATMANAIMSGRWCGIKDGELGEEKTDKYTIIGASHLKGDNWVISARIKFNKQEIVAPIPVQVKWAGDTPVITVDKLQYPGGGTYTARVVIYDHTYAGTWSGGDHGGLMSGIITNPKE